MTQKLNQKTFDTVVRHLAKQGRSSTITKTSESGVVYLECLYKHPSGDMCAIGVFIPEGKHAKYEGQGVTHVIQQEHLSLGFLLASDLQRAHDRAYFSHKTREFTDVWAPGGIAYNLAGVAARFNLDPTLVTAAWSSPWSRS